jgi:hypothetical protein
MDLWHILNVAKWRCGKVAIKREQSQARLCYAEREPLRRCQRDKPILNTVVSKS